MNKEFAPGMAVRHHTFGAGRVLNITPNEVWVLTKDGYQTTGQTDGDIVIKVDFEDPIGVKDLLQSFAKLEITHNPADKS